MVKKIAPVFLLAAGALFLANLSDTKKVRFEKGCLVYNKSEVTRAFQIGPYPSFIVPAPYKTTSITDNEDATGLTVTYTKSSARAREQLEGGFVFGKSGCTVTATAFGLNELSDDGGENCLIIDGSVPYVPTDFDLKYSSTRIDCEARLSAKNCGMNFILDNDWNASVIIGKTALSEWQNIARIAETFFEEHLAECEV